MFGNGLGEHSAGLEAAQAASPHVGDAYVGKLLQLRQEARSADDKLEQLQKESILLEQHYNKTKEMLKWGAHASGKHPYLLPRAFSRKEHKSSSSHKRHDEPRRASMGFHVMPAQLKEAKKQAAQRERDREREREKHKHRHRASSHHHSHRRRHHRTASFSWENMFKYPPPEKPRRRTRSTSHSPKRHRKSKSPHRQHKPSPPRSTTPHRHQHRKRSKSRNSSKPGSTPPKRSQSPSKSSKPRPEKKRKPKHLDPKPRRKPSNDSRSPSFTRRAPRSSKKSSTHKAASLKASEKSERQPEYETIEYEDLKFDKNIGKGSFGTVSLGQWGGQDVAIKQICVKDSETFEELENEIKIMTHLNSNCICRVYGSSVQLYGVAKQSTDESKEDAYYLVMELCETSLYDFIKQRMNSSSISGTRLRIVQQIATGLKHLHSAGIIHRDMKTANVLLKRVNTGQPQVKISDFGLSMRAQQPDDDCLCGTPGYMAPELYNDKERKYNELTDIFALGMVYHAIFSGHSPFHRMEAAEKEEAIKTGTRPKHMDWMSEQITGLIGKCWDHDPEARPTAEQVEKDLETMQPENVFCRFRGEKVRVYSKSQSLWFEDGLIEDVCMLYFDEKPIGSACVSYDMSHPQGKLRKWVRPDRFAGTIRPRGPGIPAPTAPPT